MRTHRRYVNGGELYLALSRRVTGVADVVLFHRLPVFRPLAPISFHYGGIPQPDP